MCVCDKYKSRSNARANLLDLLVQLKSVNYIGIVKYLCYFAMENPKLTLTTTAGTNSTLITESMMMRSVVSVPVNPYIPQDTKGDSALPPEYGHNTLRNFRVGGQSFEEMLNKQYSQFFLEQSAPESVAESVVNSNMWDDGYAGINAPRSGEMLDSFDFLMKSLSSANDFVTMLSREQLQVLRSIRPGLLYELLQEVAKARAEKRMRRAPSQKYQECAFCKNNGENEEQYASHSLKDWRGRVTCPVLRNFNCPRCGATGDYAHTIKYCPDNTGSERGYSRRRVPPSTLLFGPSSPSTASTSLPNSIWSFV